MSYCTSCGTPARAGARFCVACGAGLATPAIAADAQPGQRDGTSNDVVVARVAPSPHPRVIDPDVIDPDVIDADVIDAEVVESVELLQGRIRTEHAPAAASAATAGSSSATGATASTTSNASPASTAPTAPTASTASAAWKRVQPHLAFAALQRPQLAAAATSAALGLLSALLVIAIVLSLFTLFLGGALSAPADLFRSASLLLGLSVGAPVLIDHAIGTAHLSVTPLLGTIVLFASVMVFVQRGARRTRPVGTRLPECLLTGAATGIIAAALALLTRGPLPIGDATINALGLARVGVSPFRALIGGFLLGSLAALAGHARRRRAGAPDAVLPPQWRPALLTARDMLVATLIGGVVVGLVSLAVLGTSNAASQLSSELSSEVPSSVTSGSDLDVAAGLSVLLVLPNLLLLAAGFTLGGTMRVDARAAGQTNLFDAGSAEAFPHLDAGLLAGHLPFSLSLLIITVMVVAGSYVGVRAALRSAPGRPLLDRVWPPTLLVVLAWCLLIPLSTVRLAITATLGELGSGSVDGVAGPGWPSTLLMAALWTALAVAAGGALARTLGAMSPTRTAALVKGDLHPEWQLLLTDSALRQAMPVAASAESTAAALRSGALPPPQQPLRAPNRTLVYAAVGALTALITLAVAHALLTATVFSPTAFSPTVFSPTAFSPTASASRFLAQVDDRDVDGAPTPIAGDPTERTAPAGPLFGDGTLYQVQGVVRWDGKPPLQAVVRPR